MYEKMPEAARTFLPRMTRISRMSCGAALIALALFAASPTAHAICPCKLKRFNPVRAYSQPFGDKLQKYLTEDDALAAKEEETVRKIDAWIKNNKYKRLREFLEALTDEDVKTLYAAAEKGEISSTPLTPVAAAIPDQKTVMTFPFRGEFFVIQGNGGSISHHKGGGNEFSWDFIIMRDGIMLSGNSAKNESYFAWGHEVVAPATGTVTRTRNDMDDHPPMTTKLNKANYVHLDHGNGEVSKYVHCMKGSVRVKEGDAVAPGDVLCLMGDSGVSMFPHLHFYMDRASGDEHTAHPSCFAAYFAKGVADENYRLEISGIPKEKDHVIGVTDYLDKIKEK